MRTHFFTATLLQPGFGFHFFKHFIQFDYCGYFVHFLGCFILHDHGCVGSTHLKSYQHQNVPSLSWTTLIVIPLSQHQTCSP